MRAIKFPPNTNKKNNTASMPILYKSESSILTPRAGINRIPSKITYKVKELADSNKKTCEY